MQTNPQHVFRLGAVALTVYLAWSAVSPTEAWTEDTVETARRPSVREAAIPEEVVLADVKDLFPWPEEDARRSHGGGSTPSPGDPQDRKPAAYTLEVEGVFWSPEVRRILVGGIWLTEGETYDGLTILNIDPEEITVQRGDEVFGISPPEPELQIY